MDQLNIDPIKIFNYNPLLVYASLKSIFEISIYELSAVPMTIDGRPISDSRTYMVWASSRTFYSDHCRVRLLLVVTLIIKGLLRVMQKWIIKMV